MDPFSLADETGFQTFRQAPNQQPQFTDTSILMKLESKISKHLSGNACTTESKLQPGSDTFYSSTLLPTYLTLLFTFDSIPKYSIV